MSEIKPSNKTNRIEIANRNILICKKGRYMVHKLRPITVSLMDDLVSMMNSSQYFSADKLHKKQIVKFPAITDKSIIKDKVEVRDENVVDSIHIFGKRDKTAVLNFASAKHPGGGYLYGAMAQEEALCYCSTLYMVLDMHKRAGEFYDDNDRFGLSVYTDGLMYSPYVSFFRDADYNLLLYPTKVAVVTCPAPNRSALASKGKDVSDLNKILYRRMTYIIDSCVDKAGTLILGAFGCGVFGNDARDVARIWWKILIDDGYLSKFNKIVFSIYKDKEKLDKFKEVWSCE